MQQPRNQMEGLYPEDHWEEPKHIYEPVDSPEDEK